MNNTTNTTLSASTIPVRTDEASQIPPSTDALWQNPPHQVHYDGTTNTIWSMWILNLVLKIITLGTYTFWGKTRMRRYLVESFSLMGDRFTYTGRGTELLLGFLKTLPFWAAFITLFLIIPPTMMNRAILYVYPFVLILVLAASYAGLRYRYSRIFWRGVCLQLKGSAWFYAFYTIGQLVLTLLTLGIYAPYADIKCTQYLYKNSYFGSQPFYMTPSPRLLMKTNIVTLLLALVTFGVARLWYSAKLHNHIFASLRLGHFRFHTTYSGYNILELLFGNIILILAPYLIVFSVLFFATPPIHIDSTIPAPVSTNTLLESTDTVNKVQARVDNIVQENIRKLGSPIINFIDITGFYGVLISVIALILGSGWASALVMQRRLEFFVRHFTVIGEDNTSGIIQSKHNKGGILGEGAHLLFGDSVAF
ncbi:MAG: DUF898 family protein [Alphaproteobacteria bacterium]|nr:DUF898 family protein [Alphaproteobacteria bacterium]